MTLRNLALPKFYATMNDGEYVDFFHASNAGHYKLFLLALAKIFDRDDRVAGISELRNALCLEDRADLARYIHDELSPITKAVAKIMHIRNKSLVHNDRNFPRPKVYKVKGGLTPDQIREVIDKACSVINHVAVQLNISNIIFDGLPLENATLSMLKVLHRGQA